MAAENPAIVRPGVPLPESGLAAVARRQFSAAGSRGPGTIGSLPWPGRAQPRLRRLQGRVPRDARPLVTPPFAVPFFVSSLCQSGIKTFNFLAPSS